jgi:hypothetical protein
LADITGSRKTEAHLHHRFSQFHIAGEWFCFGKRLQDFLEDELPATGQSSDLRFNPCTRNPGQTGKADLQCLDYDTGEQKRITMFRRSQARHKQDRQHVEQAGIHIIFQEAFPECSSTATWAEAIPWQSSGPTWRICTSI